LTEQRKSANHADGRRFQFIIAQNLSNVQVCLNHFITGNITGFLSLLEILKAQTSANFF
jgi:hypothetical protein